MFTLAITGGIGSGKSVVSGILRLKELPVYDTDSEAKRLMNEDESLKNKLIIAFGQKIYPEHLEGRLDRIALAKIIFNNQDAIRLVNSIVHPEVKRDFISWREKRQKEGYPGVALESAILFSAKIEDVATHIVAVTASEMTRIERVSHRDHAPKEAILARIRSQMSQEEIIDRSDFVISNDRDDLIIPQVDKMLTTINTIGN
ncbi:dephospho-CoA kinase [Falsiporphyromonas endometrii]|uniref:Dephospho-CoA kinase n=1 Tax=Falsiporphyromonas endometrii TaxID=1387297 RepID=A0ABV9K633_9PORP